MIADKKHICPVELAGSLDIFFRRWVQNPAKILGPYIEPGMTVMDFGCGPGFFTIDMARMVGPSGRVIAVDLQEGMLEKVSRKISNNGLADRVQLHHCGSDQIGLSSKVDFAMAFYMVHEIPDQKRFFIEIATILNPGGALLVAEPPMHVSKAAFSKCIGLAREVGLEEEPGPRILLSKTAILRKGMGNV